MHAEFTTPPVLTERPLFCYYKTNKSPSLCGASYICSAYSDAALSPAPHIELKLWNCWWMVSYKDQWNFVNCPFMSQTYCQKKRNFGDDLPKAKKCNPDFWYFGEEVLIHCGSQKKFKKSWGQTPVSIKTFLALICPWRHPEWPK